MFDRSACLETLVQMAHPAGGWGYAAGQPAHLEPTCFAILALSLEKNKYQSVIDQAVQALQANQVEDSSYRLQRGRPQAIWPTAMVLFARHVLGHAENQLQPILNRLLQIHGNIVKADPEVADMIDIDVTKIGWPWTLNTFSWVEPTSWACLTLRSLNKGSEPRVLEGIRLLLDRAFDEGGINYGNRLILGKMTEPIPTPTALMLLAVQGYSHPRIESAKAYLRKAVPETTDIEHLAFAKLALSVHAQDAETQSSLAQIDQRLQEVYQQRTQEGRAIPSLRHALTALAVSTQQQNPFRLSDPPVDLSHVQLHLEAKPPETQKRTLMERIKGIGRNVVMRGLEVLRQPPAFSGVHIAAAPSYEANLVEILKQQFIHFRPHVPLTGKRVVLKPNLVEWHRNKVINTDPRFVGAVIELCKAEGAAEILVAEGPGHWRNVEFLVEESGLGEVLRQHQVPFVDLNHDEPVKVLNLGRTTGLEYLYLTRTITTADVFISLPKLKTHHWAGATLSLKNLFGTLPGICYGWPKNELHWRGIPNSIIDIAMTHTPHLAIVDGIIGMEGDGPLNGKAKPFGTIIMGSDLVAVDATCCRLMQLPVDRIPTIVLGAIKKLGRMNEAEIPQLGQPISQFAQPFEWPPQLEKQLLPTKT